MAKKIIMGVLFLGLVGALAVGAVNRTVAKSVDTDNAQQHGSGWAQAQQDGTVLAANLEGRGRNQSLADGGTRQANQREPMDIQQGAGRSQGSQGRGNSSQSDALPLRTIEGIVTSVDDTQMTLLTEAGEITLADRAWRYALEQGFAAQVGQRVRVTGFDENGEFAASLMLNLSTQQQVQVREQGGRPLWAGGGNQGQAGGNQGQAGGNQGQAGNAQGGGQPIAETEDHQWVAVSGVVTNIDDTQMTVQTESGEVVIADRPWSFAVQAGFAAQVGDQVTLEGFYENETFEAGRLTNGDQVVSIREDSGRPLWAGGGRGRNG